jgi:hypothetical protein
MWLLVKIAVLGTIASLAPQDLMLHASDCIFRVPARSVAGVVDGGVNVVFEC